MDDYNQCRVARVGRLPLLTTAQESRNSRARTVARGAARRGNRSLFDRASAFTWEHTSTESSWPKLASLLDERGGFIEVNWCDCQECERAPASLKASVRAIPLDIQGPAATGPCIHCGEEAKFRGVVARAYRVNCRDRHWRQRIALVARYVRETANGLLRCRPRHFVQRRFLGSGSELNEVN